MSSTPAPPQLRAATSRRPARPRLKPSARAVVGRGCLSVAFLRCRRGSNGQGRRPRGPRSSRAAGRMRACRVAATGGEDDGGGGCGVELNVVEEDVLRSRSVYCDQCRVVGWSGHPVCGKRYHFIIENDSIQMAGRRRTCCLRSCPGSRGPRRSKAARCACRTGGLGPPTMLLEGAEAADERIQSARGGLAWWSGHGH
ncbi:hypothetical protein QYE76_010220 [Lolium multiflorum]|uniref:Uncharacterized protein n=1 Tax=Lolium multiflorum TaxID=4521 RepID=A0AAD8TWR9_LOLMU|nr:hypothetical protein QYE76_010220 [Lolium multiflorum]